MSWPRQSPLQSELSSSLRTLMFCRVLFVSLLLGASLLVQIKNTRTYFGYIQNVHLLIVISVYFLTFFYLLILRYFRGLRWQAYVQLTMDSLVATAAVFATGGIGSIFSILYVLAVINGGAILYRRGAMVVASCSGLLYASVVFFHYYGLLIPLGAHGDLRAQYPALQVFYTVLVNIGAFYGVAYLSSYLSEQVRSSRLQLKAKQMDMDKLEALNESIINNIRSGLVVLDSDSRILLLNPAAKKIFEFKEGRAVGQKMAKLFPSLKPHLVEDPLGPKPRGKRTLPFIDLLHAQPSGKLVPLRLFISPLLLPGGGQKGHIVFIQDMTEVKKIEEEMKRVEGLAMVGELAAGMAHEIRNPMASISGSIQMLKDSLDDDGVNARLMDIVLREIGRLNDLVNDFLMFARPKRPCVRKFNLSELIVETEALFRSSGSWKEKVVIHTHLDSSIHLESDPDQIKQALWNLLINACEAMPEGGTLDLVARKEPNERHTCISQDRVRILVRDTGKGLDKSSLPDLFAPFFTTKEGGTGLGLAIVKRIVESLHGNILAENDPKGGAKISILLPLSFPEEGAEPGVKGLAVCV